jgi:hypothetical protein
MRKEVLWAIVAGIILGLIVAFGVWRINSKVTINKRAVTVNQTPTPVPLGPQELKVVLDKPSQNDVVTEDFISVSGLTKSGSWVTLSGEIGDYIIQADKNGSFTQEVELTPGVNQIKVTTFDQSGNQSTASVAVVYSSSFQKRTSPTPPTDASDSSDIRKKVAEDLANTINRPKAYIGVITDITDSTVEIKSAQSDIQQISINTESTNVVNMTAKVQKQVKTTDIAIGDFIVAMGYIETNAVLSAQRILITNPIADPKTSINQAKVVSVTKKNVTVSNFPDNTEIVVQPVASTDIKGVVDGKLSTIKLATINTDDILIYISTKDDKNTPSIRTIFQIQKS